MATGQEQGQQQVALRNDWYRDRYSSVLRLAALVSVALLLSLTANIVQLMIREQPKYFVTDGRGYVVEIVPVDQPLLSSDGLAQWAAETARHAYSLNFVTYDQQLSALRDRFEPRAFNALVAAMADTNLGQIREQRLVLDAVTSPAIVTKAGLAPNGHYVWQVEVPVTVTAHYGGTTQRTSHIRVAMEIMRVDNRLRPESGVVVTQFVTHLGGRS